MIPMQATDSKQNKLFCMKLKGLCMAKEIQAKTKRQLTKLVG